MTSQSFEFDDETVPYLITCTYNNQCLDWSSMTSARQTDKLHPRACVSAPNPCLQQQWWKLERIAKKQAEQEYRYLISKWDCSTANDGGMSLDANIQSHVGQWDYAFPSPFMFSSRPLHLNQQWILVPHGDNSLYCIVNAQHGKCLDGNVDLCEHADMKYKSPYLRQFNPRQRRVAQSQIWSIHPIRQVNMNETSGCYMIVNVADENQCLDSLVQREDYQTSALFPRIFMGDAKTLYNPFLRWMLKCTDEFNQYVLTPQFDPESRQLSGGNSSDITLSPFLVNQESLFHVSNNECDDVKSRRWKLFAVPGVPDAYLIVCVANGLCLSMSNTSGSDDVDGDATEQSNTRVRPSPPPPFLVKCNLGEKKDKSAMWYLKPMKRRCSSQPS